MWFDTSVSLAQSYGAGLKLRSHTAISNRESDVAFNGFLIFLLYCSHRVKAKANVKATSLMNGYMSHLKRCRFRVRFRFGFCPLLTSPMD